MLVHVYIDRQRDIRDIIDQYSAADASCVHPGKAANSS